MAELGTGKSVVVLAVVVGCFSILWPKIFYPMMQTALSLTTPKYDAEDALRCQFLLDADTTGYAFFARLCDQLAVRESYGHPRLRGPAGRKEPLQEEQTDEEAEADLPEGLMGRCQTALSAVCRLDLRPSLEAQTLKELEILERNRKVELDQCLLELLKMRQRRKRVRNRKVVNTWEIQSRRPPHLHLPPRMREAMGEARPDLPPFHPSSQQQHRIHPGHPHLAKDGRPFPHPSSRQPPKSQPKTGGAMSIVMPIYTIGIVGFFLYTLLKLLFKKRNDDHSDSNPVASNYHMDPNYHRYVLGNETASNLINQYQQQKPTTPATTGGSSKTFINESKTKRFLEEFGKQKVIGSLKTLISQMQNYDLPIAEGHGTADNSQDTSEKEGAKVQDLQLPLEKTETLDEELNQEISTNSSPDTESYELIGGPHDDSGKSESEGSEKSAPTTNTTTSNLRQRIVHDSTDEGRNRSYKLSDILQF